jgi:anaerobic ribonucleoside-triphosphate reductase activating protein
MTDTLLRIAQIVPATEAEGPGRRFALWFQGCPLRCPGCCNPEFLSFHGGELVEAATVIEQMRRAKQDENIEGISLLGGEPLAHAAGAATLAIAARQMGLSVMVYSGFVLEAARELPDPAVAELLANTDVLADGPYVRELPDTTRRWIGSTNQRVHFLTTRYREDDPVWRSPNTLEIRVRGAEISVNGFPAPQAVGLWKKPRRVEG